MVDPSALRSTLPLLVAVLVALLLVPTTASARDGARWPGRTITYYDATRDKGAVRRAVQAWNRTGVRMRFVRVFDRRRAKLLIRNSRNVPGGCGTGVATLGYVGRGRQAYINILHGYARDGQACAWPGQTFVVAHELGHVLGLRHFDRGCALMNSSHTDGIAASRCLPGQPAIDRMAQWRCRVVEPMDIRRAIRKYGGTMRPVRRNPWCVIVRRVAPPTPFTASLDPVTSTVSVSMRRPATPAVPPYLDNGPRPPRAEVYMSDRCLTKLPESDDDGVYLLQGFEWEVAEGADWTYQYQNPYPGQASCLTAFAFDTLGREGAPATAIVDATLVGAPTWRRGTKQQGLPERAATPAPGVVDLHGDTVAPSH